MSKKLSLLGHSNNIYKEKYRKTNDILYAMKALNELLNLGKMGGHISQKDYFKCDIDRIEWPIIALNEHFKDIQNKKWKKFQIGCIANLLVKEGYSINKSKKFLSTWFKCSDTYVREAYYDVKEKYQSKFGGLLIRYDDIMELIKYSGKIPEGYDGWLDSLMKQLAMHNILINEDILEIPSNVGSFKTPQAK